MDHAKQFIRTFGGMPSYGPIVVFWFAGVKRGFEVGAVLLRRSASLITACKRGSDSRVSGEGSLGVPEDGGNWKGCGIE